MPHCPNCGWRLADGKYDRFCPHCGREVGSPGPVVREVVVATVPAAPAPLVRRDVVVTRTTPVVRRTEVVVVDDPEPVVVRRTAVSSHSSHRAAAPASFQRSAHFASPEVPPPRHLAGSAHETCPGCGRPTDSGGEKLVVSGKEWHRECALRRDGAAGDYHASDERRAAASGGSVACGLHETTYLQQPSWAYAEQHKNRTGHGGQYSDGMFRRV